MVDSKGSLVSGEKQGDRAASEPIVIDRSPDLFHHIIDFYRDGEVVLEGLPRYELRKLRLEARYYGLATLVNDIDKELEAAATGVESRRYEYKVCGGLCMDVVSCLQKAFVNGWESFEGASTASDERFLVLVRPVGAAPKGEVSP